MILLKYKPSTEMPFRKNYSKSFKCLMNKKNFRVSVLLNVYFWSPRRKRQAICALILWIVTTQRVDERISQFG